MTEGAVCNASPLIFLQRYKKFDFMDNYDLHVPTQVETEVFERLKQVDV